MRELYAGRSGGGGVHTNPGSKTGGKEKIKEPLSGQRVITIHFHFQNDDANVEMVPHLGLPVWSNSQHLLIRKRLTWVAPDRAHWR